MPMRRGKASDVFPGYQYLYLFSEWNRAIGKGSSFKYAPNEIKIPVIVHSELIFGAQKSKRKQENLQKARRFLEPFEIVNYTQEMPETYAELRLKVESKGKTVGPNDLLIAAIAVSDNGTLVTRNTKEFSVILQLKVEKW